MSFLRQKLLVDNHWLNSHYITIIKWIGLLGILYLVIKFADLTDVMASFAQMSLMTFIGFMLMLLWSRFLYAFRWAMICTKGLGLYSVSSLFLLRVNLLAEFVGIAMPSSLGGEAVRVVKLSAQTGRLTRSTASIVADRLIGLISMGIIVLVFLPKLGSSLISPSIHNLWVAIILLGVVMLGLAFFWLSRRSKSLPLPRVIKELKLDPLFLIEITLVSIIGHFLFVFGHYLLFRDLQPFPFSVIVAVILTAQLARSIPISLLGISLSEGSLVALASLVGMKPEIALSVVLITLANRYIFALGGLIIELLRDGKAFFYISGKDVNTNLGAVE